jgi:hypothetical protein
MAEKVNNCTAAPRSCGVLCHSGIEGATPRVIESERAPGASGESEKLIALARLFDKS